MSAPEFQHAREESPQSNSVELLGKCFERVPQEVSYTIDRWRGELPDFVEGTYLMNGPARFGRAGVRYRHWLDGDGMVAALRFEAGSLHVTQRFVRTRKFVEEEAAGRVLYRTFGTAFEGDRLLEGAALESPANVSVYPFAGALLAFGEQGLPWELDPETLECRGQFTFGGRLHPLAPFSAHPAFDPHSGEMFNFGVSFSSRRPLLSFYRIAGDGELIFRRRVPLEFPASIHDFGLSENYAAVYVSPHVLSIDRFVSEASSLDQALAWKPKRGSSLLILDRETGTRQASISIGTGYCLHLIAAFENEDALVVDVLEMDRPVYDQYELPELFPDARGATPVRYVIGVEQGEILSRRELDSHRMCDFPVTDPGDSSRRDFWALSIRDSFVSGPKFFDQVVHCDWQSGEVASLDAPPDCFFGGEPAFVPQRNSSRAGALVCPLYDARREVSSVWVLDAFDLERGPLAETDLDVPLHLGFHSTFAAELR